MHSASYGYSGPNGHYASGKETGSKKKICIAIGVLVALLVLAAIAAFLIWLFVFKDADSDATISKQLSPSTRVFSGHMKLADVKYSDKLENTKSKEFEELAEKLEAVLEENYNTDPLFAKYYTKSAVTAFRYRQAF
ncbi:suppressor of tumorigenicity 14 protein [Xyrichtys novacula]|uniref:Suppressor of tumorigenicity 14 protein n=1 Tax=Xyrichtys novacula TaxID=13765 RepID=A0AAV1FKR8_XYRNO|nr:suppressor of tumorigenicity 14 protein [Xyrichtys novacula]